MLKEHKQAYIMALVEAIGVLAGASSNLRWQDAERIQEEISDLKAEVIVYLYENIHVISVDQISEFIKTLLSYIADRLIDLDGKDKFDEMKQFLKRQDAKAQQ